MNAEHAHSISCAGLTMGQIARLSHAVRDRMGAQWSIHPWLGRLNARVVVVGHGPQAERAMASASISLMRVISIAEHAGDADFLHAAEKIQQALHETERLPNPYLEASNQSLMTSIAKSSLDARARLIGAAWRHPELGVVVVHPRQGWVASDHRCAAVVSDDTPDDWVEQVDPPHHPPAHVCSMEQWIFQTQLRRRQGAPHYPGDLVLRLTSFPDISGVTGQPRVLQALLALQEGQSLLDSSRTSGCPLRVIDALVSALALSGLIADFHLQGDAAPVPTAVAPPVVEPTHKTSGSQLHGLRRIAHYLGISRAVGQ